MKLSPLLVLVFAAACISTAPISFNSPTPDTGDVAYGCALRKVNELGYTVTNTSRDGKFVTGIKQTSGAVQQFMLGTKYKDQLTVSIFDADSTTRKVRVTAASVQERSTLLGSSSDGKAPSDAAKADANEVLRACSKGVIAQEGKGLEAEAR